MSMIRERAAAFALLIAFGLLILAALFGAGIGPGTVMVLLTTAYALAAFGLVLAYNPTRPQIEPEPEFETEARVIAEVTSINEGPMTAPQPRNLFDRGSA